MSSMAVHVSSASGVIDWITLRLPLLLTTTNASSSGNPSLRYHLLEPGDALDRITNAGGGAVTAARTNR